MSFDGWKEYKLEELVENERGICYGIVQPGEFLNEGGVPILKVNNLTESKYSLKDVYRVSEEVEKKYVRTRLRGNEILVSLVGSLGYVFKVTEAQVGWNVVRAIGVLPISRDYNRDWIYWYLKSPDVQNDFQNFATHTVQATLNLKELKGFKIKMPDLATQRRIASILSSLDDKIEHNRQTNNTLEAIAQALFKEWFVAYNFPGATGEMQESELGEIPKGWNIKTLGEIYKTTSGGTPSRSKPQYYENGYILWVKSKELENTFITSTEEHITEEALKKSSAKLLPKHSVLIAMYGATVGEVGIISQEATCNQAICAFLPNDKYPYTFIYQYLLNNKADIISRAVGSAQQNISQDLLKKIKVVLPPIELLKRFDKVVSICFEKIENNLFEIEALTQLRDNLLPKLMKGEILVP